MSPLNIALVIVGLLCATVFYNALVAHPIVALRALARFYRLPADRRRSSVLQTVSGEWWRMAMVPVYAVSALVLIGVLGGGQ
ncbi:hypothetical protein [Xanthomonas graminis]|uniref:hypothetical protein n=1 Tax=Xanthomonas graminis TaxID=3390026 RepID=UPI00083A798B|nr:hypothetical protein [Xanthomonas translucens]